MDEIFVANNNQHNICILGNLTVHTSYLIGDKIRLRNEGSSKNVTWALWWGEDPVLGWPCKAVAPAAALALSEALDSSADPEGSALTEVALEPRQVWSLTQLYSVGVSQSKIGVKSLF